MSGSRSASDTARGRRPESPPDCKAFKDCQRRFHWTSPLTVVVSVLATRGVEFRNAAAIENLRKVDTLIIDKSCRRRLTAQAVRRG